MVIKLLFGKRARETGRIFHQSAKSNFHGRMNSLFVSCYKWSLPLTIPLTGKIENLDGVSDAMCLAMVMDGAIIGSDWVWAATVVQALFCTFACFVIFGVQTLFSVPSRHKTPQKRIYAHYQQSFLLCYGLSGFCHLSIPLPPYVQESNHFGGEGVTRHYHTRAPSIWTVTVLYLDMFDHPRFRRFFLAELLCLWKGKMKKNDAVLTSMKCKMDQEKTGASFPRNSGNWYLGQKQKNSRERC